jgi:hypothetical protein
MRRCLQILWNGRPTDFELSKFAMIAPNLMSVGTILVDYVKGREMKCKCDAPMENGMDKEMGTAKEMM